MNWFLEKLFGQKIQQVTDRYLRQLARAPLQASREYASRLLASLASDPGPEVTLGETLWGEPVRLSLDYLAGGIGFVSGGMGSGKTRLALLIVKALLALMPHRDAGFGIIDPKNELYPGTLFLLMERLKDLRGRDPPAARELLRRIVIYDLSLADPVSSFNVLARWPGTDPDFFASTRANLLLDLLRVQDQPSLGGTELLREAILVVSEFQLPITVVTEFLHNDTFRSMLVARSRNPSVSKYFARQFSNLPKSTIAALSRRLDALFGCESVRLCLSGKTAPDFRRLQDEGKIVLITSFGNSIARSDRQLLQGLAMSDIGRSVFTRRQTDRPYLWVCDEAQNFFLTSKMRDNMSELLTLSRSFGTNFLFLTQNVSVGVQDARVLKLIETNLRWCCALRGDPGDCAFLKPVLPVTGRMLRPQADPFAPKSFYSVSEERAMLLDAIAHLPERVGYFWPKTRSAEALKIRTQDLMIPESAALQAATLAIRRDASIGMRLSRKEYLRQIAERDRQWLGEADPSLGETLQKAYRQTRGEQS